MPHYDYDKDYPFAAFITNLGKYNEGALVGEWVKFPTTAEELKKVFERIGIGAKDDFGQTYEEWFITDYCHIPRRSCATIWKTLKPIMMKSRYAAARPAAIQKALFKFATGRW